MKIAIDKQGYFLGYDVQSVDSLTGTGQLLEADDDNWPYPDKLLRPRWTDDGWTEGASDEEIADNLAKQPVSEPTPEQLMIAQLTLKIAKLEAKADE